MTKFTPMLIAVTLALSSVSALAADGHATLRVERGSIMTSTGGEFASAQTGQVVSTGERLMVTEGSAATVVYSNDCTRQYTAPGVYVIEPNCVRGAVVANGADWLSAGKVALGVGVGAAILANMDNTPGPPPAPPVPPAPLPISR